MFTTAENLPSDLVLEIVGDLSPAAFLDVAQAFFGFVAEIGKDVSDQSEQPVAWIVKVYQGSALLGLEPAPGSPLAAVRRTYQKLAISWARLEAGDLDQAGLSDSAIRYARDLSEFVGRQGQDSAELRLWIEHVAVEITALPSRQIRLSQTAEYNDHGSIEGILDGIRDRRRLEVTVFDEPLKQRVKCYVPENLLDEAKSLFRRRVDVFGIIRYRGDGAPLSIHVERIEPYPDLAGLPTAHDVRGILRATS